MTLVVKDSVLAIVLTKAVEFVLHYAKPLKQLLKGSGSISFLNLHPVEARAQALAIYSLTCSLTLVAFALTLRRQDDCFVQH